MGNYLTVVPASPLAKPYLVCFSEMSTRVRDSGGGRAYTDGTLASFVVIAYRHGVRHDVSHQPSAIQTVAVRPFSLGEVHGYVSNAFGDLDLTKKQAELRVFIKLSSEEAIIEVIDGLCLFVFCYLGAFCFVLRLCI